MAHPLIKKENFGRRYYYHRKVFILTDTLDLKNAIIRKKLGERLKRISIKTMAQQNFNSFLFPTLFLFSSEIIILIFTKFTLSVVGVVQILFYFSIKKTVYLRLF